MSKVVWHKGPPPSIGWWPASNRRTERFIRWWDGSYWSIGVLQHFGLAYALAAAKIRAHGQRPIEWADRPADWPERFTA